MDAGTAGTLSGMALAVTTLVIGVAVGGLAKLLKPAMYPGGAVLAVLLATFGAWFGGFMARQAGFSNGGLYVAAVVGALLMLALFRFYRRSRVRAAVSPAASA